MNESSSGSAKEIDTKFIVPINSVDKPSRLSEEAKNELKSIGMMNEKGQLKLKGVSPKMLKRMKMETINCPVLKKELSFIQCYVCKNFQSRISGQVYCIGDPL